MKAITILPYGRVLALTMLFWTCAAAAVIETYEFSDPSLELRYHALSDELRCPKCQNQTIADSNAPIAKDLRFLLHQQLEEGASDAEILDFMVARYGEFVRYRPGLDGRTMVLWYGPLLVTILGLLGLAMHLRGRTQTAPSTAPSEGERAALRAKISDRLQGGGEPR